jgi:hypothetical protein
MPVYVVSLEVDVRLPNEEAARKFAERFQAAANEVAASYKDMRTLQLRLGEVGGRPLFTRKGK